ncbi:hypothetical protein [Crenobacter intestini]|uniref:Uncharacterized protein n=1 Tax=Crenobacter intestini TaxID=2563443 RepID=A0A4T0UJD5_9NEIS|nr:hypothetical protein [Crenobacter intestini]TIC78669.1 hypothetical protein E5K04_15340 [Crenobacter intestini]
MARNSLLGMLAWLTTAQAFAAAASDVVENTHVIAGANVGASAPAFWSQPEGAWSWFGAPMIGVAAVVVLYFFWRRRR